MTIGQLYYKTRSRIFDLRNNNKEMGKYYEAISLKLEDDLIQENAHLKFAESIMQAATKLGIHNMISNVEFNALMELSQECAKADVEYIPDRSEESIELLRDIADCNINIKTVLKKEIKMIKRYRRMRCNNMAYSKVFNEILLRFNQSPRLKKEDWARINELSKDISRKG